MRTMFKTGTVILATLLLGVALLAACGGSDDANDEPMPLARPDGGETNPSGVVITIGNLTDMTGPSSGGMETVDQALKDLVDHYNAHNLIPDVTLKLVKYDGQLDPSRDIPGYEWLIEKGADIIWSAVPGTPLTLKARVDADQVLLFSATGDVNALNPAGYVFSVASIPQNDALTLLKWIAENDPDFPADRPAKVGGAGWTDAYCEAYLDAVKAYAKAHPDQYEFKGAYLNHFNFNWSAEVEALRDCDYVFPGAVMAAFVEQYRAAGYDAKLIGSDVQAAFTGLVDDGDLWDEIDGMLFLRCTRWWNEEGTMIDLTKQVLEENQPDKAEQIMRNGCGYLGVCQVNQMLSIIANTAQTVGPENIDSAALYEAAKSFTQAIDGVERYSFGESKRVSQDYFGVYVASDSEKDLVRVDPVWHPVITEP